MLRTVLLILTVDISVMSTVNSENSKSSLDWLKWTITVLLLAAVVGGNSLYGEQTHIVLRVVVLLALVALAFVSAAFTEKGKTFIGFAKDARLEVRKVVWPTRQETVQTTLIVLVVSFICGLVLWGLDGVFVRVVSFITTSISI